MNHLLKRLSGGLLALCLLSTTAFAARVTPSVNKVELQARETAISFDLSLQSDSAFAGAEFGIRPSSPDVVLESIEWLGSAANAGHVRTVKDGVLYFGFFADRNRFSAGTHTVARLTYSYSGSARQALTLDSSKVVAIDEATGRTIGDTSAVPFAVTITRAPAGGGDGGGTGGGVAVPPAPVVPPVVPPVTPAVPERTEFADVQKGDWFYDAVHYAVEHGLFSGVGGNRFAPNEPMTRAMMVTVLYNLDQSMETQVPVGVPVSFTDVLAGRWYAEPVVWAGSTGIAGGIGGGLFGPDLNVTREQVAVFLYHYEQARGRTPMGNPSVLNRFSDAQQVSGFAAEALSWAVQSGLISGTDDGRLCPLDNAGRAQVASILMNYTENFIL